MGWLAWQAGNFIMQLQLDRAGAEREAAAAAADADAGTAEGDTATIDDSTAVAVAAPVAAVKFEQAAAESKDDGPQKQLKETPEAGDEPITG